MPVGKRMGVSSIDGNFSAIDAGIRHELCRTGVFVVLGLRTGQALRASLLAEAFFDLLGTRTSLVAEVERTSFIAFHNIRALSPSSFTALSRPTISDSADECDTDVCFLQIQQKRNKCART